MKKIDQHDFLELSKQINNPFSREIIQRDVNSTYGKGVFIWQDFGNGVASSSCDYNLKNDYNICLSSNIPGAVMIYNLADKIEYTFKNKETTTLEKNSFFIGLASDHFYAEMSLKKRSIYKAVTIGIKEELFLELADKLENLDEKINLAHKNGHYLIKGGYIDSFQHNILSYFKDRIVDDNILSTLKLESMALNLGHYTINKIIKNNNLQKNNIEEEKVKSLEKAKEIIMQYYSSSLTIKEIAYKSAINECYLKKDFKIYYGMTVYEMIQDQRLKVAKGLLEEDLSVKEVTSLIGYKHIGNFSKLFSNKYNISPSLYRKQNK